MKTRAAAGLRFTSDSEPGYRRKRSGRGFIYFQPSSQRRVRRTEELHRIAALAIPPAWRDVWICKAPNCHLQATGIDVRGRKQYRYHPDWNHARNEQKFDRMPEFGGSLASIRRRVDRDLRVRGMTRDKVIACVVRLLDRTLIRIGNDEYARDNKSYGLTTLRNSHVAVVGSTMTFQFNGKSGKRFEEVVDDKAIARIVRQCQDLPGQELFEYIDAKGKRRDLGSADVNEYLMRITGENYTAKDFRNWGGTVAAANALQANQPLPKGGRRGIHRVLTLKQRELDAVRCASTALGNTVATCRKFYVHPRLLAAYASGQLDRAFRAARRNPKPKRLTLPERAVLRLLKSL